MFNIPIHSFYMMIFISTLLVIASLIRWRLKRKKPQVDDTELKQRIQSWWWMIAIYLRCYWRRQISLSRFLLC